MILPDLAVKQIVLSATGWICTNRLGSQVRSRQTFETFSGINFSAHFIVGGVCVFVCVFVGVCVCLCVCVCVCVCTGGGELSCVITA